MSCSNKRSAAGLYTYMASGFPLFELHAIPQFTQVDEAVASLPAPSETQAQTESVSLRFYRGEATIDLLPVCDAEASPSPVPVPVHVMDFHRTMLPPSCEEIADADEELQVELFRVNVLQQEITQLTSSLGGSARCTASPMMSLLFPSVQEGNLTPKEWANLMRDGALLDRIHYSYTILLHFYGWRLHDQETGELDRHKNWRSRYDALSDGSAVDCYAVWTRMLRVLLELKLTTYAARFLLFLLQEMRCGRLRFLQGPWDAVWWPLVERNQNVAPDVKTQIRRRRRRLDVSSSDEDDDEIEESNENMGSGLGNRVS